MKLKLIIVLFTLANILSARAQNEAQIIFKSHLDKIESVINAPVGKVLYADDYNPSLHFLEEITNIDCDESETFDNI